MPLVAGSSQAAVPVEDSAPLAEQPLRRVILISCDTLSALHMSAYGHDPGTTATFDSLATAGVLFRNCLVPQVWTLSSHLSMLTGLAPGVHRVGKWGRLPESIPLLSEILRANRFVNGAFLTENGWLAARFGFARGFHAFQFNELDQPLVARAGSWCTSRIRFRDGPRSPAAPFLLFLHFMDPHTRPVHYPYPYYPIQSRYRPPLPEPSLSFSEKRLLPVPEKGTGGPVQKVRQWDMAAHDVDLLRAAYDSCVVSWDRERLRGVLAELRRTGHLRDTLIIVTSDHGEEIADHGDYLHNQPFVEVRRVPLLFVWPGRLPTGKVVDRRVSVMDLTPTILDLAGFEPPPNCQGLSLRPLLADPGADFPVRDFMIDGHHRGYKLELSALVARAHGRWWSLIAETDTTGCLGTFRPERVAGIRGLFDLAADPGERADLQGDFPDLVAELRGRLEARLAENAGLAERILGRPVAEQEELSKEEEEQLRALGY